MDGDGGVYSQMSLLVSVFFHGALQKAPNVILIIYDAGTDNMRALHREGTLSAFLKKRSN